MGEPDPEEGYARFAAPGVTLFVREDALACAGPDGRLPFHFGSLGECEIRLAGAAKKG